MTENEECNFSLPLRLPRRPLLKIIEYLSVWQAHRLRGWGDSITIARRTLSMAMWRASSLKRSVRGNLSAERSSYAPVQIIKSEEACTSLPPRAESASLHVTHDASRQGGGGRNARRRLPALPSPRQGSPRRDARDPPRARLCTWPTAPPTCGSARCGTSRSPSSTSTWAAGFGSTRSIWTTSTNPRSCQRRPY